MRSANKILKLLPDADFRRIEPHLTPASLVRGQTLAKPYDRVEYAYFPHDALLSVGVTLPGGTTICSGLIGNDGLFGAGLSLDDRISLPTVKVLASGEAAVIAMPQLKDLLLALPEFRKRSLAFEQFFLSQVQQTAACAALHTVPNRLSAWLHRIRGYVGNKIALTQDEMSQMLGVRRTSVTEAALTLQKRQAISYQRGVITVLSAARLAQESCGCHDEVASHYKRLFVPEFNSD